MEPSTIAIKQFKVTIFMKYPVEPILDYYSTHLYEKIRYKKSNKIYKSILMHYT